VPCCNQTTLRFYGSKALVGLGLLHDLPRSRKINNTTLGRTPLDEWSDRRRDLWQHATVTRDRRTCPRRYSNPQLQRAAICPRLTSRDHQDRPTEYTGLPKKAELLWAGIYLSVNLTRTSPHSSTRWRHLCTTNSDQVAHHTADNQRRLARCV
jgi:hypothetical protein